MIGANLARRLAANGHQLFFLCRSSSDKTRLERISSLGSIIIGDITDRTAVHQAVTTAQPHIVYHLASTRFNTPVSAEMHFQVTVLGTLHLLEALRESPSVRFVSTGSVAEYGGGTMLREDHPLQPGTTLGASKASASILIQTYARLYGLSTVTLRLFTPYGPLEDSQRLIPHTILSAIDGRDVAITRGDQQRDFIYIDDVVDALSMAGMGDLPSGSVFNIGSGVGTPVLQVVERILKMMGNPVKVVVGALQTRADEIIEMSADTSLARRVLGWVPTISLDEGLGRSINWFRKNRVLVGRA